MADKADRHALYQESVQCVESEIDFVDKTYRQLRKRKAKFLREDFCGTANTSCEWVRRRSSNHAIGIDIDPSVLEWGGRHNVSKLSPGQRKRIELVSSDVLKSSTRKVDIVLAMNFSYWLFTERSLLRKYFKCVRKSLVDDGILFMDAFGGYEAFRLMEEETEYDDFTYVWDQDAYDPITGDCTCHIHFKFPDGSKIKKAFTYHWRLWTLPEIREILLEAGFSKVTVYWDMGENDEEENFVPSEHGEPFAGWIAYIVAEK